MRRLSAALALLVAVSGSAQQHPNDARGFAADKLYDFHDLDAINGFNGNLTIRIPIGQVFHVNALISYQFLLVYNSHCWHFDEAFDINSNSYWIASPLATSNAGLGWSMSLGRLYSPLDPANSNSQFWVYESPDGSQHTFYQYGSRTAAGDLGYTRDNTYLQMRAVYVNGINVERDIDFPDGTTRVFQLLVPTADMQPWPLPNSTSINNAVWRLVRITSAKANTVQITYRRSITDAVPYYQEIWTVADTDRSSTVYFVNPGSGSPTIDTVLDHIVLPAIGGPTATATYTFVTTQATLPLPSGSSQPAGGVPVLLLSSVLTPLDTSGSRAVYSLQNYDTTTALSGVLHQLVLPTQGSIHWDYTTLHFPNRPTRRSPAIDSPIAITQRQTFQPGATSPEGTWLYGRRLSAKESCYNMCPLDPTDSCEGRRQMTSWVLRPISADPATARQDPQYGTISYFSIYDADVDLCANAQVWRGPEYGLPFTRFATSSVIADPLFTSTRYLSSQLVANFSPTTAFEPNWDGRGSVANITSAPPTIISSTYVAYTLDDDANTNPGTDHNTDHNARPSSVATVYDADRGCSGGPCYTASDSYKFDGFGHFRQHSTVSNFPGDDTQRTDWKGFLASTPDGRTPVVPWISGLWDKHCVARTYFDPSSSSTNPCSTFELTAHALFDSTSGLLLAQRTLAAPGDTANSSDVLTAYTYDDKGYTQSAKYAGGDTQTLSGNEFTPPTNPKYEIDYMATYSPGGAMTARSGAYAIAGLSLLNETYDTNTGLLTRRIDPAGVTTTYRYDLRNRLLGTSTTGTAPTAYAYTDASYSTGFTPATATVSKQSATDPSSAGLVQQRYDYDGFGRLWHERRLLPSGTAVRETLYTPTGLTQQVSEFEATPTHFTVFAGFDAFDRPTRITAADGHVTSASWGYDPQNPSLPGDPMKPGVRRRTETKTVATGTNGSESSQTTTELYDALHRPYQISEASDATHAILTTYGYDTAGHLASVNIASGGTTQTRTFHYDNRGFLQYEQHPESGTINYGSYDARGHLGSKTVNSANSQFDLKYDYDPAERLRHVYSRDPNSPTSFRLSKEYTYGTSTASTNLNSGKLDTAKRYNYDSPNLAPVIVTETNTYNAYNDPAGRLTEKTTTIDGLGPGSRTAYQDYAYNDLGLLSRITYPRPDAYGIPTWSDIQPQYTSGRLTTIQATGITQGTLAQPDFTSSNITYWPNGMVNLVPHNNGVTDTYSVDSTNGMPRPSRIQFTGWSACTPPTIANQSGNATILYAQSDNLFVTLSAGDSPTFQWYQGQTAISGATAASYTATPTQTTMYWVRVTNSCGHVDSAVITVSVKLRAPVSLVADRSGANSINIAWQASTGATSYQLYRESGGVWSLVGTPSTTSFADIGVASNLTFVYQVRAAGTNVITSDASNNDIESTLSFTSVTAGRTISVSHFNELLNGVNSVRWASGQAAQTWSQVLSNSGCPGYRPNTPDPGNDPANRVVVYGWHILSLRCAMDSALTAAGVPRSAYTDAALTNVVIKAIHVTELQLRTDYWGDGR